MPRGLSLYLDIVRFTAAMLVLLGHSGTQLLSGGFLWQLLILGDPCVVVFFVLSGFVIAYVTSQPGTSARGYAIARTARVLSVTLPALGLTFALDAIGRQFDPGLYDALEHSDEPALVQLLAALTFLNESWFGHIRPGSNGAYWSLGYEVWYYVAFGLAVFAPQRWRLAAVAAALLVAGPRVASLFPLWLLGVGCFHACRRWRMPQAAGLALWAGTLAFGAAFWAGTGMLPLRGVMYTKPYWELWTDYAVGLWFALNAAGAWFAAPLLERWLRRFAPAIRAAADVTFTLYLVHFPVMVLTRAASPWPSTDWRTRAALIVVPCLVVALAAHVTEYRKEAWRRAITRLFPQPKAECVKKGSRTPL